LQELGLEKKELRKAQHELKKQHVQLIRDRKSKEDGLLELDARAYDVQVRKHNSLLRCRCAADATVLITLLCAAGILPA
jgi:hypothetical protein